MDELIKTIYSNANPEKAKLLQRFFKTGIGEYGEGDRFLGIIVPVQRTIAKTFSKQLTLNDVLYLLKNPYHEVRLIALLILIEKAKKADNTLRREYMEKYLKHTAYINNWDLVDLSAHHIVGAYLLDKDKSILYQLAKSELVWDRRIAVLSCFAFIKAGLYQDALEISQLLMKDKHDLIHKAVGWMLREIGKRDRKVEEKFLNEHFRYMPRTMLRYAIEKFDEKKRRSYMKK